MQSTYQATHSPPFARSLLSVCIAAVASIVIGANAVVAQDTTPVRSLGQSSPGMAQPLDVPSTLIKRQRELSAQPVVETKPATHADGTLIPWWEGAEAVALESMEVNPFALDFTITAGIEYDDNLYLNSTIEGEDSGAASYFGRGTGTLTYKGGSFNLMATYSPEYRIYDGGREDDGFNQSGALSAGYVTEKSSVGLTFSISQTDGANVEIGDRTDAISVNAGLNASHRLSEKISIGAGLSTQIMEYDEFNSFGTYSANTFLDYKISPKTSIGVSAGYNRSEVEEGANANAFNAQGRLSWVATEKLSFVGSAGAEFREFEGGRNLVSPIYSVGAVYVLSDLTSITFDSYRRNTPSLSQINQSYYSTGILIAVSQSFRERFNFNLGVGYENAEYESSTDEVSATRNEDYFYIRPQLSYTFLEKYVFTLYYQYSQNDANDDGPSYNRNLIGATFSVNF